MVSVYRRTKHVPWVLGRIINASEDAIGVTARTKTHADALPMFKVSEGMNDFEVRISCNDTSTPLTGVARFYARRKNDDLCFLGSLAITTGDQVCGFSSSSGQPMYYIHLMVPTDKWITEMHLADENGNDGMSRGAFNIFGYDEIHARIEYTGASKEWRLDYSGG